MLRPITWSGEASGHEAARGQGRHRHGRRLGYRPRLFAQEGATVLIADVTGTVREGGTPTHELLRAEGFPVEFVKTDVSAEWEAEAVVRHTSERHGCLAARHDRC